MRAFLGLEPEVERTPVVLVEEFPKPPHRPGGPKGPRGGRGGEELPMEHPDHEPGDVIYAEWR